MIQSLFKEKCFMLEKDFRMFLKIFRRKTPEQIDDCVIRIKIFEEYIRRTFNKKEIDEVTVEEFHKYVSEEMPASKDPENKQLFALQHYFSSIFYQLLKDETLKLYSKRTGEPMRYFHIKKFHSVEKEHVKKLNAEGIIHIMHMLTVAKTPSDRKALAKKTDVPESAILLFTKLSNLARIDGLKGTRARLYYDAGVDTLAKLATYKPEQLREHFIRFSEEQIIKVQNHLH